MSKEKPIIFSTPMVQAILAGRKTMTRRVVKHQPPPGNSFVHGWVMSSTEPKNEGCVGWGSNEGCVTHFCKLPYQIGDILWVRETWCKNQFGSGYPWCYKASEDSWVYDEMAGMWKPSIHMPRSASRIFLRVKSVRVERLQDITEEDAKAEGVARWNATFPHDYKLSFTELWDNLNAKRGYGWGKNPWVWVIEFERMTCS